MGLLRFVTRKPRIKLPLLVITFAACYVIFLYLMTEMTLDKNKDDIVQRNVHNDLKNEEEKIINSDSKDIDKGIIDIDARHAKEEIIEEIHNKDGVRDPSLDENIKEEDKAPEKEHEEIHKNIIENKEPVEIVVPHLFFGNQGLGQNGAPVKIDKQKMGTSNKLAWKRGYTRNDFNEYVSNLISVDRQIPDIRDPLCQGLQYPEDLPDTSVIICFVNEAWSVLIRSVHSVINTSPPHLLKEIILVDDFSTYDHLKAPLEFYLRQFPKVRLLRNSQREGLIRSRLSGAAVATGQVLTFLDSHIECVEGWLPPLLVRIKEDHTHVTWPVIPAIDADTFEFRLKQRAANVQIGIFTWQMTYAWAAARVADRESVISPVRSPVMAGGLFSIDRNYFYEVGSYDDKMQLWGGENLEMSFRIWMCGGTIEIMPCSVVGHIFRGRNVNIDSDHRGVILYNKVRTSVAWMDEYKFLWSHLRKINLGEGGDVSKRVELRNKLSCKSFRWYLDNVYTDAFIPDHATRAGFLQNVYDSSKCLQSADYDSAPLVLKNCDKTQFNSQLYFLSKDEELRHMDTCVDTGKSFAQMVQCHRVKGHQQFMYLERDQTIFNPHRRECLGWVEESGKGEFQVCDGTDRQRWRWLDIDTGFLLRP